MSIVHQQTNQNTNNAHYNQELAHMIQLLKINLQIVNSHTRVHTFTQQLRLPEGACATAPISIGAPNF